jgi:hypothetical protein
MKKLAILLLLCTGCYTPVTNLKGYIPEKQAAEFPTVDSVLTYYLVPEAHQAVEDIPTVIGNTTSGYAAGTSRWSSVCSWLTGSGIGRKVIFSEKSLYNDGYPGLIHEYVHHLDDMTRDGSDDPKQYIWINLKVFLQAYKMLKNDYTHKGIQLWCDSRANGWVANTFGVGEAAEHVAYIAMYLTSRNKKTGNPRKVPEYLKAVFSRILNIPYKEASAYTTTSGKKYLVTASPDKIELVALN